MAQCKDCGADTEWATTKNAKQILLDATDLRGAPLDAKRFVVIKGVATLATAQDKALFREMRTCHWDTCRMKRS